MKRLNLQMLVFFVFFSIILIANTQAQKATPDAVGFGAKTRGAYAGSSSPRVLIVDNLSDENSGNESTGRGSLRWAATRSYPRIVIFEISGYISLKSALRINSPYITIAGQTAPSPGITVRHYDVYVEASEVIIQHLRFRLSDEAFNGNVAYSSARDAFDIFKGPNIFVDHCSFSWSIDELFSMQDSNEGTVKNVTISNCIMSEALANSLHPKGEHGYGQIISSGVDSLSIIGNLYAHLRQRAPEMAGVKNAVVQNNLIYNTRHNNITIRDSYSDNLYANARDVRLVIKGNKLINGANTLKDMIIAILPTVPDNAGIYIEDNTATGTDGWRTNDPLSGSGPWTVVDTEDSTRFNSARPLIAEPYAKMYPSKNLEDYILPNVGARPKDRDRVDERVVNEVRNGTGSFIDSQSDVGGFPSLPQNRVSHSLPNQPHEEGSISGYTNLEVWLYNKHLELTSEDAVVIDQSIQIYDQDFSTSSVSSIIGQLKTYNPSSAEIQYEIVEGDNQGLFSISSTGLLTVNNSSEIVPGSNFTLIVTATSANSSDQATVNVLFKEPKNTININIGSSSFSEEWNDLLPGNSHIETLNYSDGITSDISFSIWSDWRTSNGGDVSGNCYPDDVIRSYVFSSDNTIRYFSLNGLNNNKAYTLEFLSSRSSEAPGGRGAYFIVGNVEKEVNAKGNTCELVALENIQPINGQIQIGYRKRVTDSDGHVNALIITEKDYTGESSDSTKSGNVIDEEEQSTSGDTPPIIVLDYEESVNSGTINNLVGARSFDPDGEILTYSWIAPEGVSLSSTKGAEVTYLAPEVLVPTTKSFVVEVSDGTETSYKSIEVTFTPYKPEVSKIQVASIKASHFEDNNHPINLLDGDPTTYWSAKGDNHWVTVELSSEVDLSHLKLAFHGMEEKKSQFDILLSNDNENWESIFENFNSCGFSDNMHLVDCENKSSTSYKYIKILGHGTNVDDINSISELEIFGNKSTSTAIKNENVADLFRVYPNPASGYFYVDLEKGGYVSLFEISGENIFQKYFEKGQHRVDVEFPRGCYVISVQSENHITKNSKLIIN